MGDDTTGVLIVGHGLIGSAVLALLHEQGVPVAAVGRRAAALPRYHAVDLAREDGRLALREIVDRLRPGCVLLVHGPSDVTWIDANPDASARVHCGTAALAAGTGVPVILVSSDNVFPGTRGGYRPEDPVSPANGYGRVKSLAEDIALRAGPAALVVRVSLVYGWAGAGLRSTFAQRCLDAAVDGRPSSAPVDQTFTPVHVRDAAVVLAAVCRSVGEHPGPPLSGIRHLAGSAELSRYEFARLAYEIAGADPSLVRPCQRRETEWACRPRFSSLSCGSFSDVPGLSAWRPMTPGEGLRDMLAARERAA